MIAIHSRKNSFSDKWIEYCEKNNIQYKLVDCYNNEIMSELGNVRALLWHWHHNDYKALQFAKSLTISLESIGIKVFPNTNTVWHFDDKIAQKYLFEAIKSPLIPSYVFYEKNKALDWISTTTFPKVFKLKGGAGAQNVVLIKKDSEAKKYINKAFNKGFSKINRISQLKEKFWGFKRDKNKESIKNLLKGLYRLFFPHDEAKNNPIEKNYLYAQDFVPNNNSDIRIIVIGDRAFAIKRLVRDGDFRASGSGKIIYDKMQIPIECIKIAFETTKKIKSQCASYDFVFLNNQPMIVEVSYGFSQNGYLDCPGYWNSNLNWIEGSFTPEFFIIENILASLK